jgi:hypothetical protein
MLYINSIEKEVRKVENITINSSKKSYVIKENTPNKAKKLK